MSTITNVGSSSAASDIMANTALAKSGFSKQTFLELLVTQLKNQDPLDPQDSSQFVAELASFSSLEQMANMSASMETVLETSVTNLIGKRATVADAAAPSGYIPGTIEGIQYYSDGPAVKINGVDYPFSVVQNILEAE
jgi:flagellar basal-body rod modification protein FlgD